MEPGRRTGETRIGPPEYKTSVGSNNAIKLPFCSQVRNTVVCAKLGKLCRTIPTDFLKKQLDPRGKQWPVPTLLAFPQGVESILP